MFLTLEIHCTASMPISTSMDVASLECTAWVSTCSFLCSSLKWARQLTDTFTMLQSVVKRASQNSTTYNQHSHQRCRLWPHWRFLCLQPLLNRMTTTTTMILTASLTCLIGLNAPHHRPQQQLTSTRSLQRHPQRASKIWIGRIWQNFCPLIQHPRDRLPRTINLNATPWIPLYVWTKKIS